LTAPGRPENVLLFQCRLANESAELREVLLILGLEHGESWYRDEPAWYRADFQIVRLEAGEETLAESRIPGMRNIHLGIKREAYVPKVRVVDSSVYQDRNGVKGETRILHWNWNIVKRPGGIRSVVISGFLRNFDEKAKTVRLRARMKPRPDAPQDYDGDPDGYEEAHEVAFPEGEPCVPFTFLCPIAGIPPAAEASLFFDPLIEVISVQSIP
jgi:hypothetical protein